MSDTLEEKSPMPPLTPNPNAHLSREQMYSLYFGKNWNSPKGSSAASQTPLPPRAKPLTPELLAILETLNPAEDEITKL